MRHHDSQHTRILNALRHGLYISPDTAKKDFGCARLAARVSDMRKDGMPVLGDMVYHPNGMKHSVYWMVTT